MGQSGPAAVRNIRRKLERLLRMLIVIECLLRRKVYAHGIMLLHRTILEFEHILLVPFWLRRA